MRWLLKDCSVKQDKIFRNRPGVFLHADLPKEIIFFAQDTGNINKYERITSINMQNIYRYWQALNKRSHKEV
jgi:hypothetical protein